MQRPDEKKRRLIVATAAKMFATRPFHKVRLDDIAAAARIGKGTLYVYFDNKEDLYFSLIQDGFERLVEGLRPHLGGGDGAVRVTAAAGPLLAPSEALRRAVDELVAFAFAHPHFFELMRTAGETKRMTGGAWGRLRQEFLAMVAGTIRRGVADGSLADPHPDLTATCVGGMVRSIMLFGPKGLDPDAVAGHVYDLLIRGIGTRKRRP
ncbi:MAG TPA: TetR/AcrR family transcriptional regulator [Humisphaera sp.]